MPLTTPSGRYPVGDPRRYPIGGIGGRPAVPQAPAQVQAAVTYTPNGIPRQPGFINPTNPYDTGRHGESNRELNNGQGGKMDWWDYDRGQPKAGVILNSDGIYGPAGGSTSGSDNANAVRGGPNGSYLAGMQLAAGLLGLRGWQPQNPAPISSDFLNIPAPGGFDRALQGPADLGTGPTWEGAPSLSALRNLLAGVLPQPRGFPRNAI